MKTLLRVLTLIVVLQAVMFPLPAWAASSASVTSLNTAFENKSLIGEDFSGQNLQEAQFTNVNLTSANFSNLNLIGAIFNGVLIDKANLHGANLSYAISYVSNFNNTDLGDAILVGSIFKRTSFVGADITGADFTGAALDPGEVIRLCKIASGVNSQTGANTKESLECK